MSTAATCREIDSAFAAAKILSDNAQTMPKYLLMGNKQIRNQKITNIIPRLLRQQGADCEAVQVSRQLEMVAAGFGLEDICPLTSTHLCKYAGRHPQQKPEMHACCRHR